MSHHLAEWLDRYFAEKFARVRSERTKRHYRRAIKWLIAANADRGALSAAELLTNESCRRMLAYLLSVRGQEPVTANTSRKFVVAFAAWCRDENLIAKPITVDRLMVPMNPPEALSDAQVERLWKAAKNATGDICGIPRRVWWPALLSIEFDAAIRAEELRALRWEWLDLESGLLRVPASVRKGRRRGEVYRLSAWALECLAALRPHCQSDLILGDISLPTYYEEWNKMQIEANLPKGRRWKTHALRRTVATAVAAAGGDPSRALRQMSPAVTWDSYVDPSIAARPASDVAVIVQRLVAG